MGVHPHPPPVPYLSTLAPHLDSCSFRPQVEIATLTEWLAFEDRDSCLDFLEDLKVVFELTKLGKRYQKTSINCKDSYPLLVAASQKTMGVAAWAQ